VVPVGAQEIQDGGRPPFKKPLNCHLCNRLTDFDDIFTVTHTAPLQRTETKDLRGIFGRKIDFLL